MFFVASVALIEGNSPIIFVLIYAIIGAFLYMLVGAFVGAVWPLLRGQPWRLTIARLMVLVAVVGVSLPPFLADVWLGSLVPANTLIVLPVVIAVLVAADRLFCRNRRPSKTNA